MEAAHVLNNMTCLIVLVYSPQSIASMDSLKQFIQTMFVISNVVLFSRPLLIVTIFLCILENYVHTIMLLSLHFLNILGLSYTWGADSPESSAPRWIIAEEIMITPVVDLDTIGFCLKMNTRPTLVCQLTPLLCCESVYELFW